MKRLLDILGASLGLVIMSPVLGVSALCIWLEDGRPILFIQERAGHRGVPFRLLKLRSMRVNTTPADSVGTVTQEHPLLTRTGSLLRRIKVDELPQLVNVLRGEMSLVGPRPTLVSQVTEYDNLERRRLDVPPGLTGWAQVHGNIQLDWNDRIALDIWYVDHWSLTRDLAIIWKTFSVLLFGEHIAPQTLEQARQHADSLRIPEATRSET